MSEEKKQKIPPFPIKEHYSVSLNSLKHIYTQHPDFNGNVRLIYELLYDYWNPDYGYAFPTVYELARESGLGISTVERCLRTLVKLDLIEKKPTPIASKRNNVYIIKPPITTLEEFLQKFPEVRQYMQERIAKINAREAAGLAKLDRLKQKQQKPAGGEAKAKDINLHEHDKKNKADRQDDYKKLLDWL